MTDDATFSEAWQISVDYAQQNARRDLLVGGASSGISDGLAVVLDPRFLKGFNLNSYYVPVPDYSSFGGPAGVPVSELMVGSSGLQFYRNIPGWYPIVRATADVAPDAISNTGLITPFIDPLIDPLYAIYLQQQGSSP